MNFLIVSVALLLAGQDTGTAAYTPSGSELAGNNRDAPEGTNNTEGVDANGERRICRRITTSSTHQYRRVCMTARQWRQYDDDNG